MIKKEALYVGSVYERKNNEDNTLPKKVRIFDVAQNPEKDEIRVYGHCFHGNVVFTEQSPLIMEEDEFRFRYKLLEESQSQTKTSIDKIKSREAISRWITRMACKVQS